MPTDIRPVTLFDSPDAVDAPMVSFRFDDRVLQAPQGVSLAAALLLNGVDRFRATPVSGAPRAPYCMMGVCFECLVEVDGLPGRQSCLTPVREGLVARRQEGASQLALARGDDDER